MSDRDINQDDLWVACEISDNGEYTEKLAKEMRKLLRDARRENGDSTLSSSSETSKSGSSPTTPANSPQNSPHVSGHVSPDGIPEKQLPSIAHEIWDRREKEQPSGSRGSQNPIPDDMDLVWNWASTPEIHPRKNVSYKRPKRSPLNLSIRKTSAMKSGFFSWDFLQVFIPSMILSNIFAFGFGIYIGKRLAQPRITSI